MRASERISDEVRARIREEIQDAHGSEILVVCDIDEDGLINRFRVAARGNLTQVPAPFVQMESGVVILHNHPSGTLRPSDADLAVSAELANRGIGSAIVDNGVEEIYIIAEPMALPEIVPLEIDGLAALIDDAGAASRVLPGFEPRPPQIDMLRLVARVFNDEEICAAEAGTGVGKSVAYLIPAIAWATTNHQRVVVSTATINLQQQLLEKDIPAAAATLGVEVRAVLLKGRGNYLCPRRLREAMEEQTLFAEEDEELQAIAEWAALTETGSRTDLSFYPSDELWSRVNSDTDSCSPARCPNKDRCFILRARREAASADLLVVNHHLLFSDLSVRLAGAGYEGTAILPPFTRLIFDEAHALEKSATSFFSRSFSELSLKKQLGRIWRMRGSRRLGLVGELERLHPEGGRAVAEIPGAITRVQEALDTLNSRATAFLSREVSFRVAGEGAAAFREALGEALFDAQEELLSLCELLSKPIRSLSEEERELPPIYELRTILRRFEEIGAICEQFRHAEEEPEEVFWLDRRTLRNGARNVRFTVTPLEIAPVMREAVFEPFRTVVCTSATLTVRESFDFWGSRIGLPTESERCFTEFFPSPFRYREQVLLGVPTDAPPPDSVAYLTWLKSFLWELLSLSEGAALVLFTSYGMLDEVYEELKPRLSDSGISSYRQGEDDRARLLSRFKQDVASVLFATDSFWEGVDAPGETLKLVVLCRLPFRVPTDPVHIARMEALEKKGRNPFFELALPEAAMRLKQGFGRLMRHHEDRGAVVVTDNRIVTKRYGTAFLDSLPESRRLFLEWERLLGELERFFYS
ncbi:MAG: helicase C-terminal domain-containing protein [Alkalispirochaetaceae bacterium]